MSEYGGFEPPDDEPDVPSEEEVPETDEVEPHVVIEPRVGAATRMAENESSNVRVAVSGAVSVAPTGTAAPVDADSALTGFTTLGYITEDGVEISPEITSDDMKAWQNAAIVRSAVTEEKWTAKFAVMETNKAAVELYFGNMLETGDQEVNVGGGAGMRQSFVIDVVDGTETMRFFIAEGAVTEWEPLTFKNDEAVSWGVTVTAYPAAGGEQIKAFFGTALA